MRRRRPNVGDVIQIELPCGRYAYGRVLRDASVAFYRQTSTRPGEAPIGSREYQFVVGVYDDLLKAEDWPIVGKDPSHNPDEDWPPPQRVTDPITKAVSVYHKGAIRPAHHLVGRLEGLAKWN